jgi:Transposase DDE domain
MVWDGPTMRLRWYQRNQEAVSEAIEGGRCPDVATTMASGPLDELVALHDELGAFDVLEAIKPKRARRGLDDELLLRTLSVMPFLECHSFTGAAGVLFQNPAILLHLGWSPFQIRMGDKERRRSPAGRQAASLPCSPETLRDELTRVGGDDWVKTQLSPVKKLVQRGLVTGGAFAIDGSGLGENLRLISLDCVSSERPFHVAWRLLEGTESEKGREALPPRELLEQALAGGVKIELLLVDALYADGPFLAWCKYEKGIDVLVPIPHSRQLHHVPTLQGHKQLKEVDLGAQSGLTTWDSFIEAAKGHGVEKPALWGCLIRPVNPTHPDDLPWTLVSTKAWSSGAEGFESYRLRWRIENGDFRELKEGWGLEEERWGAKHRRATRSHHANLPGVQHGASLSLSKGQRGRRQRNPPNRATLWRATGDVARRGVYRPLLRHLPSRNRSKPDRPPRPSKPPTRPPDSNYRTAESAVIAVLYLQTSALRMR